MTNPSGRPRLEVVVLGAVNWDTTIFLRNFAEPGAEVVVEKVESSPGGKGANVAVAASRILGKGRVAFVGALGTDDLRGPLLESLRDDGVRTDGVATIKGCSSGRAFVLVDGSGRKSIYTLLGANDALEPRHLTSPGSAAALAAASTVVIMDVPLNVALAAARSARREGRRAVYSSGVRSAESHGKLAEVLRQVHELVVDRSELARLTGLATPAAGVEAIRREFPRLIVVATLGPAGCLASEGRTTRLVRPADLGRLGLKAVNSTGSGDAFLAAHVSYSMMGLSPAKAAAWGNLAGALKATSPLTRGSPTRNELESKMLALGGLRRRRPGSP
ncbi:MAG: hypothetical protein KGI38_07465 [Thaumarchaeota archaeon]|nr:hypothetical protein [Nitrososphaerota archaeon]